MATYLRFSVHLCSICQFSWTFYHLCFHSFCYFPPELESQSCDLSPQVTRLGLELLTWWLYTKWKKICNLTWASACWLENTPNPKMVTLLINFTHDSWQLWWIIIIDYIFGHNSRNVSTFCFTWRLIAHLIAAFDFPHGFCQHLRCLTSVNYSKTFITDEKLGRRV